MKALRTRKVRRRLRQFFVSESGVIAIEFALVVPVLLALFLGGIDTAWLVIAHYKLERAADSVADLTARAQQLRPSDVQDIFAAASMVAKPFDLDADGRVIASSVTNPTGTGAIVDWQQASAGGVSATSKIGPAGGTAQLGTDISVELGETMIVGEAYLDFQPIIGFLIRPQELYVRLYERARYGVVERVPE